MTNGASQHPCRLSEFTLAGPIVITDVPTLLNVFEADYEVQYSESYTASRQK